MKTYSFRDLGYAEYWCMTTRQHIVTMIDGSTINEAWGDHSRGLNKWQESTQTDVDEFGEYSQL